MGSLVVGTKVQVRTAYDRAWASGFEVAEPQADDDTYVVRRLSDGRMLPRRFAGDEVRRDRRDDGMWWV